MSRNMFHSPVDWNEIEALRKDFGCASLSGSRTGSVAIDIDGRPFVPVYVNGEGPFMMVFETGHRGYLLTDAISARFHLTKDDKGMATLDTFSIGDTCWHGMRFGLDDTRDIATFLNRPVDGLLGNLFWMLMGVTPTLDYPGQRLHLSTAADATAREAATHWVPMEILGFCPFVSAMINGKGPFRFHIDTGAGPCLLSQGAAERMGLSLGEPCRLQGTLIDDPAHAATLKSFSVGKIELRDLPVKVSSATLLIEKNIHGPVDGAIGTSFLQHFVVTFDYSRERFGLVDGLGKSHTQA